MSNREAERRCSRTAEPHLVEAYLVHDSAESLAFTWRALIAWVTVGTTCAMMRTAMVRTDRGGRMIPQFNQSGVLPPFDPALGPNTQAGRSPYKASTVDLVRRFGTSAPRNTLLGGLLEYRKDLRSIGVTEGFQWIDGSFVENVEMTGGRDPRDIDIVTLAHRPAGLNDSDWRSLVSRSGDLFSPKLAKTKYFCDAYFVDLGSPPQYIVEVSSYWSGLFSHQRNTSLWKGLVQVPLVCDDDAAAALLA